IICRAVFFPTPGNCVKYFSFSASTADINSLTSTVPRMEIALLGPIPETDINFVNRYFLSSFLYLYYIFLYFFLCFFYYINFFYFSTSTADINSLTSTVPRMEIALLGPIPETDINFVNRYFSSSVLNPYNVIASSLTW